MGESNAGIGRIAAIFVAVTLLPWGFGLMVVPEFLFGTIGGATVAISPIYSRYAGAWFIGVAVGAILLLRNRRAPGPFFDLCLVGGTLAGIALLVDLLAGKSPLAAWFIWLAIVNAAGIAALSWKAR